MPREALGAFIDAVYAIAITILALEIPEELGQTDMAASFGVMLGEYALAFSVLFSLWVHHRRLIGCRPVHTRGTLWLSAIAMLMACLIPRATTLVFTYHPYNPAVEALTDVAVESGGASAGEVVDIFYMGVILVADLSLWCISRSVAGHAQGRGLATSKSISTTLVFAALVLMMLMPFENRYFAILLPVALLVENELVVLFERWRGRDDASSPT